MEGSLHHVADLNASIPSVVEGLVGHPLRNDEVLYVAALRVQSEPMIAQRNAAWDDLESVLAEMQQRTGQSGLTPEQIDELLDAECDAVRYGHGT